AIYFSFLTVVLLFIPLDYEILGIILGATLVLIMGIIDDIHHLSAGIKFAVQVIAAAVLIRFGVAIEFVGNPFGGLINLAWWLSASLTLFWIVGATNTINFIDGLDGLAAGVSAIALLALGFYAYQVGQTQGTLICLALAGSTLGFLKHNFHPARIFMGDSGSMFLGFMLGAITVQGVMKSIVAVALLVPIVIMGVPIFDTAFAIFRRYRNKKPLSIADKGHIHHRLLHKGFSQRQTVLIIYLWSILLSIVALTLRHTTFVEKVLIFILLAILSFLFEKFVGLFDDFRKSKKNLF
ncbi:MAG: MraY family glycosyltransferase, partial [Candidatus Subteraquimicrobiales bacterium]|nr:MraY family glycosyltransferase [Candidatus Subteraquimicrobiales bacterium]